MTVDRQQIRRDAEQWMRATTERPTDHTLILPHELALHCLALLAELEETEERWKRTKLLNTHLLEAAEKNASRLAKVPALVGASQAMVEHTRKFCGDQIDDDPCGPWLRLHAALAAWEAE